MKRKIQLTEGDLREMVRESVERVLNEIDQTKWGLWAAQQREQQRIGKRPLSAASKRVFDRDYAGRSNIAKTRFFDDKIDDDLLSAEKEFSKKHFDEDPSSEGRVSTKFSPDLMTSTGGVNVHQRANYMGGKLQRNRDYYINPYNREEWGSADGTKGYDSLGPGMSVRRRNTLPMSDDARRQLNGALDDLSDYYEKGLDY